MGRRGTNRRTSTSYSTSSTSSSTRSSTCTSSTSILHLQHQQLLQYLLHLSRLLLQYLLKLLGQQLLLLPLLLCTVSIGSNNRLKEVLMVKE